MPDLSFTPRLMPAPHAAHYLGVSTSTLRKLPIARRELGSKRVYDKADLDRYVDTLPYEASEEGGDECDQIFGIAG